jgi:hypothetical protein
MHWSWQQMVRGRLVSLKAKQGRLIGSMTLRHIYPYQLADMQHLPAQRCQDLQGIDLAITPTDTTSILHCDPFNPIAAFYLSPPFRDRVRKKKSIY